MRTRYQVYYGNTLQVAGLEAMYEAILYIRNNLLDASARDVSVTRTTYQEFKPGPDMPMVDFLAWLGEEHGT